MSEIATLCLLACLFYLLYELNGMIASLAAKLMQSERVVCCVFIFQLCDAYLLRSRCLASD